MGRASHMLRRWQRKFEFAFRGLAIGIRGQDSFWVHVPFAIAVLFLAAVLQLRSSQWCLLILCISIVLAAEYFNSSLETLVRRLHPDRDPEIAKVLDTAAAAVFVTSIGAAAVGLIVLAPPLLGFLFQLLA